MQNFVGKIPFSAVMTQSSKGSFWQHDHQEEKIVPHQIATEGEFKFEV